MPMRLGEYYTIEEFGEELGVSKIRAREIIQSELVYLEYFGRTPAVPKREVLRVLRVRAERRVLPARAARDTLLNAGFIYMRKKPDGTESGRPHYPGLWRRGWWGPTASMSADGDANGSELAVDHGGRCYAYYGLTALEALKRFSKQV